MSFLLFNDKLAPRNNSDPTCDQGGRAPDDGRTTWIVAGTATNTFPDDSQAGLQGLAQWRASADPWGRERHVLMSLGGAQGFSWCQPVTTGMEEWTAGVDRSKKLANDPDIKKLYDLFSCTGWDWDLEGSGDRGRIGQWVADGDFLWDVYLTELNLAYPDMKMFTAAPEIAPESLDMYADWFEMGPAGTLNIFDQLELSWEVLIGIQYYNNAPQSVDWLILGGAGKADQGLGLNWDWCHPDTQPSPGVKCTNAAHGGPIYWDDFITSDDIQGNAFTDEYDIVGMTVMQAVNFYINKKHYANMHGNMGILTPNGRFSCSNVDTTNRGGGCDGWSNYHTHPPQPDVDVPLTTDLDWSTIRWDLLDYQTVPTYVGSWAIESQLWAEHLNPNVGEWWQTMAETLLNQCCERIDCTGTGPTPKKASCTKDGTGFPAGTPAWTCIEDDGGNYESVEECQSIGDCVEPLPKKASCTKDGTDFPNQPTWTCIEDDGGDYESVVECQSIGDCVEPPPPGECVTELETFGTCMDANTGDPYVGAACVEQMLGFIGCMENKEQVRGPVPSLGSANDPHPYARLLQLVKELRERLTTIAQHKV